MKRTIKALASLFTVFLFLNNSVSCHVEISYFTSTVVLNDVTLEWGTVTEIVNELFRVERASGDSVPSPWKEIGFVLGHGTTSTPQNYVFHDTGLTDGSYIYRLKQVDFTGDFQYYNLSGVVIINTTSVSNINNFAAEEYILYQNYPNPFNPVTKINFGLPFTNFVSLKVYDVSGNEVSSLVNERLSSGTYSVSFDASELPSGTYFCKITSGDFVQVKKMMLVR